MEPANELAQGLESAPEVKKKSAGPALPIDLMAWGLMALQLVLMSAIGYTQYQSFRSSLSSEALKQKIAEKVKETLVLESKQNETEPPKITPGFNMPLGPLTTNLAKGEGKSGVLKVSFILQYEANSNEEEIKSRDGEIKDITISLINAKSPDELLSNSGKHLLKEEIKSAINSKLIDGILREVFIVTFQINWVSSTAIAYVLFVFTDSRFLISVLIGRR